MWRPVCRSRHAPHRSPACLASGKESLGNILNRCSAYTPVGYIHNARHDFGNILRFVEHNFGIKEGALNFADSRPTNDLSGFYDLTQLRVHSRSSARRRARELFPAR